MKTIKKETKVETNPELQEKAAKIQAILMEEPKARLFATMVYHESGVVPQVKLELLPTPEDDKQDKPIEDVRPDEAQVS